MAHSTTEELTYAAAQSELNSILEELQGDVVSIDDLGGKVQRARELLDFCLSKLRGTEEQIRIITKENKA